MAGRTSIKAGLVLLAAATVLIAARLLPFGEWLEAFSAWVVALRFPGMVIFATVYALAAVLLFPAFLLTLAAGAAYGLGTGFVIVSVGATLGAAMAFLVSRHFARQMVEKWIEGRPRFGAVDKAVARKGWKIVALTRLSPVFPFNFQNYAYGLTRVAFWHFTLASLFAMMPGTFMYVYVGTLGRESLVAASGAEDVQLLRLVLQGVGLVATVLVTILITRTARKALKEAGV